MIELVMAVALMQAAERCNGEYDAGGRPPGCPDWRQVVYNGEGEIFVDPAPPRREGNRVEAWTRTRFRAPREDGMGSVVSLDRYDCAAGTVGLRHFTAYDPRGVLLVDIDVTGRNAEQRAPQPGSPNAVLLAEFCPR